MARAPASGGKKTTAKRRPRPLVAKRLGTAKTAVRKTTTTTKKTPAKKTVKQTTARKAVAKFAPKIPAKVAPRQTTPKKTPAKKAVPKKAVAKKPAEPKKRRPVPVASKTLEKLKARLEEERETYMRQADELAAEAEALMADREQGDTQFDEESGEGDTINVERERDLALSASARQSVEEIDEALARIKAGKYGVCRRCGNRIPLARLEAVPQASLCIECKSRQERRR